MALCIYFDGDRNRKRKFLLGNAYRAVKTKKSYYKIISKSFKAWKSCEPLTLVCLTLDNSRKKNETIYQ